MPAGGGDAGGGKYLADHPLGKLPGCETISAQIARNIHEHLVDGVDHDILRRGKTEIYLINPGAVLHVFLPFAAE